MYVPTTPASDAQIQLSHTTFQPSRTAWWRPTTAHQTS